MELIRSVNNNFKILESNQRKLFSVPMLKQIDSTCAKQNQAHTKFKNFSYFREW